MENSYLKIFLVVTRGESLFVLEKDKLKELNNWEQESMVNLDELLWIEVVGLKKAKNGCEIISC